MRFLMVCGVLVLGACGDASDPAPMATERSAIAAPSASAGASSPAPPASALLDEFVIPRQTGPYAPRDECEGLPGARAFRERLAIAVAARDAETIAAMAVPEIRLGFGGQDGRKRFLDRLKAPDGKLMGELRQLLQLGCVGSEGGGLTIPWYFQQEFGDAGGFEDSYSSMLVTGVDVPLRAAASPEAPVAERLSWDIVTLAEGLKPDAPFQRVKVAGGKTGYIATESLRSLLDYRMLAIRQGGEWKITALLAGD